MTTQKNDYQNGHAGSYADLTAALPDDGAPDSKQRYAAEKKSRKQAEGIAHAKLREAVAAANAAFQASPDLAGFRIAMPQVRVGKKQPKEYYSIVPAIAAALVVDTLLKRTRTQAEICRAVAAEIKKQHPGMSVSKNAWTWPLSQAQRTKIKEQLRGSGIPVQVTKDDTLASIRRKIEAQRTAANAGQVFKTQVAITPDRVAIGKRSYPVQDHGGRPSLYIEVQGKRAWLRVDALAALLGGDS